MDKGRPRDIGRAYSQAWIRVVPETCRGQSGVSFPFEDLDGEDEANVLVEHRTVLLWGPVQLLAVRWPALTETPRLGRYWGIQ